ncbi:hypothetical protein [Catelliglobosispora koreensis]|nr:hypothetical protein [Catelliglobosispora koreensis]
MTAPFLRDPKQRDDRLQLIVKITVYGGAAIGTIVFGVVVLASLVGR